MRGLADCLDWKRGSEVSVLADGAPWIWKQAREHLPEHEGVLGVFHLLEHLHDADRGPRSERLGRASAGVVVPRRSSEVSA